MNTNYLGRIFTLWTKGGTRGQGRHLGNNSRDTKTLRKRYLGRLPWVGTWHQSRHNVFTQRVKTTVDNDILSYDRLSDHPRLKHNHMDLVHVNISVHVSSRPWLWLSLSVGRFTACRPARQASTELMGRVDWLLLGCSFEKNAIWILYLITKLTPNNNITKYIEVNKILLMMENLILDGVNFYRIARSAILNSR